MAYTPLVYDYNAHKLVLLGGTNSQFSIDDGVSWLALRGARNLGTSAISQNPRNVPRLVILIICTEATDKELTLYHYDDDTNQVELIKATANHLICNSSPFGANNH